MSPQSFVVSVAALRLTDCFNPYSDLCPHNDLIDAPTQRLALLETIVTAAVRVGVRELWIGRDLGYRGGRRTGLALTDDLHATSHVARWGGIFRPLTKGPPVAERTAAVVWSVLDHVHTPVFLWNVFPLHPHVSGQPLSNRSHNAIERRIGEGVLDALVEMLRPMRAGGIGRDAVDSLTRVMAAEKVVGVRHPSYGGQTEFLDRMRKLYCPDELLS